MLCLQTLNGLADLSDLICLGISLAILNVYAWGTEPWRFVYAVTSTRLSCLSEIVIAYPTDIAKADPRGIAVHLVKNIFQGRHEFIVSILISPIKNIGAPSDPDRDLQQSFQRTGS
jgi:hypothetical protein